MNIGNGFSSIEQVRGRYLRNEPAVTSSQSKTSSEDVLELKFSKHARKRLADRNISLTDEQLRRLEEGTKKAQAKGINESLVLMDDMAFIVNVKNNTTITVMNQQESAEKVYTNIDGAVII